MRSTNDGPAPESDARTLDDLLTQAYEQGREVRAYVCPLCGYLFVAGSFRSHLTRSHPGEVA